MATAAAAVATTSVLTGVATAAATIAVEQTTTAATATAATINSTAASSAVTTIVGRSLLLTADQGDADDREENRDAKNKRAIHLRILLHVLKRSGPKTKLPSIFVPTVVTASNWARYVKPAAEKASLFTAEAALLKAFAGYRGFSACTV